MKKTVTVIDPLIAEFEKLETELAAIKPTESVRVPFEARGKWLELCFEQGALFVSGETRRYDGRIEDQDPLVILAAAMVTDVLAAKVRATTVTPERIQKAVEFMQRRNVKEGTNEQR